MLLEIDGLCKQFGGIVAVRDVSFAIAPGEIVGVFGPNGSGKTTLLNLVAGVLKPTRGQVRWKGAEIQSRAPHRIVARGIVKTFQNPQLFRELTAREHLQIAGHLALKRCLGWRRIGTLLRADAAQDALRRRAEDVLGLCRLDAVGDEKAANLSYGEEKMLGLAMALMCDPELLLLDEPGSGLGNPELEALEVVLRGVRAAGTTLCIIDHRVAFLRRLADRAISLHHGSKIAEGTPVEVLEAPEVVKAYLGSAA